jgi:flavin-binding protein dodecin
MEDHVYKSIHITGTSSTSQEEAIRSAVRRAAQTVRHMRWFEVIETRGVIDAGEVVQWQVTVRIGFTLDEPSGD